MKMQASSAPVGSFMLYKHKKGTSIWFKYSEDYAILVSADNVTDVGSFMLVDDSVMVVELVEPNWKKKG